MASRAPTTPKSALIFVFLTVLLSMIGMGIVIPVMPDLLVQLTGMEKSQTAALNGELLMIYAVMQFIMSPILGGLSDRFGRRPVLLVSLLAYSLDFLLMALAPTYAWLFVGRALSGAFAATFATASAFIADISPPEKRSANFGLIGAAFGLGFIIGPILGGHLGAIDPRAPFFAASAVTFANFLFGYFVCPETVTDETRRKFDWSRANPLGGLISVSKHPLVLGVLLAFFLMQTAHHSLPSVWSFFAAEKFGWGSAEIGNSLAFVGLSAAFVQGFLTRKAIPALGETRAVLIGILASVAAFVGYAFFTPTGLSIVPWVIVGSLGGFIMPGMQGIMSRATPDNAQGELQGAIASVMSITLVVSPYMMTHVFAAYTAREALPYVPGAPFIVSAVLLLGSMIPFWLTMRRVPDKPQKTAVPVAPPAV